MQERLSVSIGSHQHGAVAVVDLALRNGVSDCLGDEVGFFVERLEVMVRQRFPPRVPVSGVEPFADTISVFQPIGIIVLDQAVGSVENRLRRAVVFGQHNLIGVRIAGEKLEDVADCGAPELIDRLIIVPTRRQIPMPAEHP